MDFAKEIADEFDIRGIKWDKEGGFGYYTDTAVFMDSIPECTNISAGGFNEHYKTEWVDLNYTYEVYKAAIDVDWESLTTKREFEERFHEEETKGIVNRFKNFTLNKNFEEIKSIFKLLEMNSEVIETDCKKCWGFCCH
jgi:hypothetical protein